jgi:hypothetical protein
MRENLYMRIASFLVWIAFATSAIAAAFDHDGVRLGTSVTSLPKGQYQCASGLLPGETQCRKKTPGTVFGAPAKQVELTLKNGSCQTIFVDFSASDAPKVGKALKRKYGAPNQAARLQRGIYQLKWRQGEAELLLTRDGRRGTASILITRSR